MNYLYIQEDGSYAQKDTPPSPEDLLCIGDGILSVLSTRNGVFIECDSLGVWSPVQQCRT